MKKSNFSLIIVFISIFVIGCKKETQTTEVQTENKKEFHQLEKAKWLFGNWENLTAESNFREIWKQKNDSTMSAESFVTVQKDTVFHEKVDLIQRNDSLFYMVSVVGQNNEKPVSFYLTQSTENLLVFENPKHDFPNKIEYNKKGKDSIVAKIYGLKDGKEISEEFPMTRSK